MRTRTTVKPSVRSTVICSAASAMGAIRITSCCLSSQLDREIMGEGDAGLCAWQIAVDEDEDPHQCFCQTVRFT